MLVDTGSTTLCLPEDVIEDLDLEVLKEGDGITAMGLGKARIYQAAKISLHSRERSFKYLGLPMVFDTLFGIIPS